MAAARSLATPPSRSDGGDGVTWPAVADVLERVPGLAGQRFVEQPLPGGLTNRNARVTTAGGRQVVVRLSSPQSALLAIDRDSEAFNTAAASEAGVAPGVVAYLPDLRALVIEWIDAQTFEAADLDDSATLAQVAGLCRRLHAGPRFRGEFDMFDLQHRYLDLVLTRGYRLPAAYLDGMAQVAAIRAAVEARPEPTVPCHNDLLAANILATGERLWFIDFEYSGNGDPCFELGNLCSESHLGPDRVEELVTAYYGAPSAAKTARARLLGVMSNYGWTLWACIQAATSDVDFDFWSWGSEKYERAVAALRGPDLSRLLTDVQQP